ncbi:molybdopterin-dependent oxidoreductase, partial [Arthrobacter sp. JCM 19049]|uniref:molybdopterin-dependent oxidoreductase n=1 Tax=Arthrobacter sp. JCM 19049 TaxID=1460643 RepID=UPI0027958B08
GHPHPVRARGAVAGAGGPGAGRGVEESEVERWVQSACVLCSNGCGIDIAVKDGTMVGVRGRAADRVNHGRLGPKGLFASWQAMNSPDRLTTPMIRQDGELVPCDWDTAMERIVQRSRHLLQTKGPLSHGSTPAGSCSWRSTTPRRSWARPGSAPHTWTAIPGCAPPPPPPP